MNKHPVGGDIILPNGSTPPLSKAYRAGDLLFISGQLPFEANGSISSGDIEKQTALCLSTIEAILHSEGLSKNDLVKLTIWLTDKADFPGFNKAYAAFMGDHRPARSTVKGELMIADARVEIEAVAAYPG